jgi:hypothetical protein
VVLQGQLTLKSRHQNLLVHLRQQSHLPWLGPQQGVWQKEVWLGLKNKGVAMRALRPQLLHWIQELLKPWLQLQQKAVEVQEHCQLH